jgi:small subunit ribosomal protein S17
VLQGVVVSDQERQDGCRPGRAPLHPSGDGQDRAPVEEVSRHDEDKAYKVGDIVRIRECKPISKLKRWEVLGRTSEAEVKA